MKASETKYIGRTSYVSLSVRRSKVTKSNDWDSSLLAVVTFYSGRKIVTTAKIPSSKLIRLTGNYPAEDPLNVAG